VRRIIVIVFGAIQAVLTARIAIDFGFLPAEGGIADLVVPLSETLAAPIQVVADAVGVDFSGIPGAGIDPAILTALIGWSIVEGLVLLAFSGPS
jgi:hypothetical protein